jgi:hypothetical protein
MTLRALLSRRAALLATLSLVQIAGATRGLATR